MVIRKKICKRCETEQYIYARGMCKPCDVIATPEKHGGPKKQKTKIKAISDKQAKALTKYRKLRDEFMRLHEKCNRCGGEATDLHHIAGRVGDNLTNVENFMALCRPCHLWVETHPEAAKQQGYSKDRL